VKGLIERYGEWALVTGASAGIGMAYCEALAKQGINLVMIARREAQLRDSAHALVRSFGIKVKTLALDLSDEGACNRIAREISDLDLGLAILNAGTVVTGEFTRVDSDQHQKLIELNVAATTRMAHYFAARFAERKRGAMVIVASLFAFQGVPMFSTYCASKAYLLTLGEGLSVELKPLGVDVLVVSPGPIKTKMLDSTGIDFSKMPIIQHEPEMVARSSLRDLGKKISMVPGMLNKIYAWENRFMPRRWPIALFGFLVKRAAKPVSEKTYDLQKD
jgi:short-subunit dehydrogenase